MPGLQTRTIQPHQFIPNSGGRVLTSGTRGTSEPARRLDQLYGEYIHARKIPFHEVGKNDKGVLGRSQPEILYVLFRSGDFSISRGENVRAWSPETVIVFIIVLLFRGRYSCRVSVAWPRQITPLLLWRLALSSCKSFPSFQEICLAGNYNMRAKTIVKDNLHDTAGMGRGHAQANIKNKGARVRARGLQCRLILIFNRDV